MPISPFRGETFGWGLIGASNIAREFVAPAIKQSPGNRIVGVYSADPQRGAEYAAKEDAGRPYADLTEMLADPAVSGVYVSTTNDLHHDQVVQAANAGKHVLCEKPLALDLRQALAMRAACLSAGVVLATNHHLRNAGSIRLIRDLVRDGRIGEPFAARVAHAIYLPKHVQGWRLTKPEGGGVTVDVTVHDADTLRFVLGDEPIDVVAQRQTFGMARNGLEDGMMTAIAFRSGLIAQTHDSYVAPFARTGLEFHGTKGSIFATDVLTQRPVGRVVLRGPTGEQELAFDNEDLYVRQIRHFVNATRGEGSPSCTGDDGIRSLAVALAVRQAAETGARVSIQKLLESVEGLGDR